jgi:uncharacterized glyoxalase superfamily protein PhnB
MPNFAVMPSLRFADLPAAMEFYTKTLGFTHRRGTAEEGNIALDFGDASVMIEGAGTFYSPEYNAAIRERLGRGSANALYMEAPELEALYERVQAAGARIVDPLAARDWGQSEFTVEDPAGNWLTFWKALSA